MGCTSCDRCGGDGFVHISDRLDTGFGNYGPADEDIGKYILTGDAEARASLRDNAVNGALAILPAVTKWGYNKLSRHCPVCNPNGSKDSADSNVKSCTYCAGDGLVHKHDNGCPNCVCTTSGKRREECDEWHVLGGGYCKTTPCSKCTGPKFVPARKAAPTPKPIHHEEFSAGDKVSAKPFALNKPKSGIVKERTAQGYTVAPLSGSRKGEHWMSDGKPHQFAREMLSPLRQNSSKSSDLIERLVRQEQCLGEEGWGLERMRNEAAKRRETLQKNLQDVENEITHLDAQIEEVKDYCVARDSSDQISWSQDFPGARADSC